MLVLGYPTREDGSPHPLQRARVAAGVAALRAGGCGEIVLSGAAVHGRDVEAQTMAGLARELGVAEEQIVIEDRARTTWENVGCAAPRLAGFDRILVVSEGLHARRAKRYFCRQIPAWCERVVAVRSELPLTLWPWKVGTALYELRAFARDLAARELGTEIDAPVCPAAGAPAE